ncbi:MAG TPA: LLM class F420-dependent oxidoreductase [Frankiaceae bacterium]|jgi:F420-dependent oxidoreductase-like protein|nr:LLM class F420-dependent oxidoreductase [Frankiaceae bacterium]
MSKQMKLGLSLGYWGAGKPNHAEAVAEAERLGFDSIWTAESWGSDALTPLAWLGAQTTNIRLGTALMQLSARTPTAAAMAALTMDLLSDGRFVMGLGVSGPQVVEGWYGEPFGQPLARTREYIKIVRDVMAREKPVTNDGPHYPLPYPGGTGLGKPLKPITHPLRPDLPIILGAEGPKNIALAAEVADGWLPIFYAPKHEAMYRDSLNEGFARPGARRTADDFEVLAGAPVIVTDDVEAAADLIRPGIALYIGGMGAKEVNFHARVYERMGYEAEVAKIQDLYLAGHKAEAIAAVPTRLIEETALIGPMAKLRDDLAAWQESFVTCMLMPPDIATMRTMTELLS